MIDHRRVIASLWARRHNEEDRKAIRLCIEILRTAERDLPKLWVIK